jgi:hypothetical protein
MGACMFVVMWGGPGAGAGMRGSCWGRRCCRGHSSSVAHVHAFFALPPCDATMPAIASELSTLFWFSLHYEG